MVPQTLEHLRSLAEGDAAYEKRHGMKLAPGLREMFLGPEVSAEFRARLADRAAVSDEWRDGFLILDRGSNLLVGAAGFVAPPGPEGFVEIAYGVVPEAEGRGHATAAARLLTERAFADGRVMTVRAHTLPERNGSARVLEKNGFRKVCEVADPVDGTVWRWEIDRPAETRSYPGM